MPAGPTLHTNILMTISMLVHVAGANHQAISTQQPSHETLVKPLAATAGL